MRILLKFKIFLGFTILLFSLSGCATNWVQKSPEWKPDKSTKVLLSSYRVTSSEVGMTLKDAASIIANEPLEDEKKFIEMSEGTYPLIVKSLEKFKLFVSTDRTRTASAGSRDNTENGPMKMGGYKRRQWIHPDGNKFSFIAVSNLLGLSKTLTDELKGDDKEEVFLSAETYLQVESNYIFWKSYVVTLTINILNQNGEPVFQSKSKGYTNRGFWDTSIDENRIQNALEEAINVMKEIEMENEISTFSAMSESTSLVP